MGHDQYRRRQDKRVKTTAPPALRVPECLRRSFFKRSENAVYSLGSGRVKLVSIAVNCAVEKTS